jgi:REP element-mobilizing transposase RayT
MARPKQLLIPALQGLSQKSFGGSRIKGNAREARPISIKRPMHLVLRSTLAKGERSLLRRGIVIEKTAHHIARLAGVRVYRYANGGNHLHLVILPRSREAYHSFVRALTGIVARLVLGAQRGHAKDTKFWDTLPFTLIIEWGRQFRNASDYVLQNFLEAEGIINPVPRKRKPPP